MIALIQGMRPPVIQPYVVRLAGLPAKMDGKVIIAMSDLHLGAQLGKSWLAARIEQVSKQNPDMVVLLGDIVEGHSRPPDDLIALLGRFSAPLGVFAVTGNHEFHGSAHLDWMAEAGFQVLRNRWREARPGFVVVGVDDLTSAEHGGMAASMMALGLKDRPSGVTLLLSHSPLQVEKAAMAGVGLMLWVTTTV